ncbi:MAG: MoaD/ThiS family protein [Planctomycetaceae bacterium]
MKTVVKLFARARDLAGSPTLELDLPESATATELRVALGERVPALQPILSSLLIAVGNDYAAPTTSVAGRTDLAVFPPVSGG